MVEIEWLVARSIGRFKHVETMYCLQRVAPWFQETCVEFVTGNIGELTIRFQELPAQLLDFMGNSANIHIGIQGKKGYPLVNIQKPMENHHFSGVNQLQIVIFNSYVSLPEGRIDHRLEIILGPVI
jgi:hypothetical protein